MKDYELYRFIILFEFNKNIIVFQELFILKEKKQSGNNLLKIARFIQKKFAGQMISVWENKIEKNQ
ncbi:hypothetical protein DERP_005771 [Dermatophagoides pteronyssinus]|uniref:Uncharacterized protein n=1 Tax=Dermatophagoides pteronyssinus TaxID=6956 RepID=A0ABQ8J9H8_DERPT|nr:hypothetical protein DERP_005771 [Dermatophagoides pteronyssinus]